MQNNSAGNKQTMWKYMLFWSKLLARWFKIQSLLLNIWLLYHLDNVACAVFLALMDVWLKGSSSKKRTADSG